MKTISKFVIDNIGGTEYGPAASFRDIVRAIVKNTREIVSVATPMKFEGIPEPVFVGTPLKLGRSFGPSLYDVLSREEKKGIWEAAKAIYETFLAAMERIE
jgi:malate/lactate dehydrogenase